ncbi:MAG TPA: helix-turn-helix domain-containing protein [bacterium]|nr:helix-turn-helix domain-containing protein [bacterium]
MVIERIHTVTTTEPNDDDLLIDGRELAKWLGLSPRTIEVWRWKGGGPDFRKTGRYVKYAKGDVRKWLDDRKYSNTSQYKK